MSGQEGSIWREISKSDPWVLSGALTYLPVGHLVLHDGWPLTRPLGVLICLPALEWGLLWQLVG